MARGPLPPNLCVRDPPGSRALIRQRGFFRWSHAARRGSHAAIPAWNGAWSCDLVHGQAVMRLPASYRDAGLPLPVEVPPHRPQGCRIGPDRSQRDAQPCRYLRLGKPCPAKGQHFAHASGNSPHLAPLCLSSARAVTRCCKLQTVHVYSGARAYGPGSVQPRDRQRSPSGSGRSEHTSSGS
jgi:hypothetical protein